MIFFSIGVGENRLKKKRENSAEFIVFSHLQIAVETVTEVGDPKEVICEAVEKYKIQLLVVGSHGRGALGR